MSSQLRADTDQMRATVQALQQGSQALQESYERARQAMSAMQNSGWSGQNRVMAEDYWQTLETRFAPSFETIVDIAQRLLRTAEAYEEAARAFGEEGSSASGSDTITVPTTFEGQTNQQVQAASATLGEIEEIDPAIWQSLSPNERLEVLQDIEDRMAAIQGRTPSTVIAEPMTANTYGYYNEGIIAINNSNLSSDMPVNEFLDTILHESRHAYQDYAIHNPEVVVDPEVVESWEENWNNYMSADIYGYEAYYNQPIEVDARNYAEAILNNLG
jgi:uncharacterized protein YukE